MKESTKTLLVFLAVFSLALILTVIHMRNSDFGISSSKFEVKGETKEVGDAAYIKFARKTRIYEFIPKQSCYLVNDTPKVVTKSDGTQAIVIECDDILLNQLQK